MQRGYVQCRDGVNWTPKKQPVAALSFLGRGRVSLENGADDNLFHSTVYAHHCGNCKIVLIPYGSETPKNEA